MVRVLVEPLRDLAIDGVLDHRHVSIGHDRVVADGRVLDVDGPVLFLDVDRLPLPCAGGRLLQPPVIGEEEVEIPVVPLGGMRGPGPLDTAGDRVPADPAAGVVVPAQALLGHVRGFRVRTQKGRVAVAVALAHGVTASGQRDRLLVIHCHPGEGLADLARGLDRIGLPVHPFRVHIDQAHLDGRERILHGRGIIQIAVAGVGRGQPLLLGAPVGVLLRVPDVFATKSEAEGLEPHRLVGHGSGKDDQVGPADLVAIFLLQGPKQAPRLVEVHVVGPGVQWRKALVPGPATAAAVRDPVGTGRVPGHPDHQPTIVAPVGRPPVLAVRHQRVDVSLQRVHIEPLEGFAVVESFQRVCLRVVLVQNVEVKRVRPPFHVVAADGAVGAVHDGAFPAAVRVSVHRSGPFGIVASGPGPSRVAPLLPRRGPMMNSIGSICMIEWVNE